MADFVHINEASEQQLRLLLGANDKVVARLLAERPFQDLAALREAMPAAAGARLPGLMFAKLDINIVKPQLLLAAGLSQEAAVSIVAKRPIRRLFELAGTPGIDGAAFGALVAVFRAERAAYTDKLTGEVVELSPRTDEVLVKLSDQEGSGGAIARRFHGLSAGRPAAAGRYAVYRVPQTESHVDAMSLLKDDAAVDEALPSFRDSAGSRRHLDPAFCVIQFAPGTDAADETALLAKLSLEIEERHRTPGLLTARLSGPAGLDRLMDALAALNGNPAVRFAEPAYLGFDDFEGAPQTAQTLKPALPWHLDLIGASAAWTDTRGNSDVVIAVIDTGIDQGHPALAAGIEPAGTGDNWNFEDDIDPAPVDENGHGTFIAGLLIGDGASSVSGICPECRVLPLKVPLTGSPSAYARRRDAILYAVERIKPPRRLIINLSWKTAGNVALIRDAIDTAAAKGALILASAGNWPERESEPHFPSDYPAVVSVGAVGPDGGRAAYSYFGLELDLAAPGGAGGADAAANLVSAGLGGGLTADFGTSFAAPLAAGAAALIWSRNPSLTAGEVRAMLERTATPIAGAGLGAGLVTLATGVAPPSPPTPSPTAILDFLNSATVDAIVDQLGLLRISTRLIVARRPLLALADLWPTLGLSKAQFDALAHT